jgi:pimeloyl-ACP methyl ester carboxylesterase
MQRSSPVALCVLLHPHGDQHNDAIAPLFAALDGATRFDFISSDSPIAAGQVLAQLSLGPAWLAGYSFGGGVASLVDDLWCSAMVPHCPRR